MMLVMDGHLHVRTKSHGGARATFLRGFSALPFRTASGTYPVISQQACRWQLLSLPVDPLYLCICLKHRVDEISLVSAGCSSPVFRVGI
jgi:hypothetical protein